MQAFAEATEEDRRLLEAATEAARAAAAVHRDGVPGSGRHAFSLKGRADFVTEVDREAERRCLDVLHERFPDHRVLAEEGTQAEGPRRRGVGHDGETGAPVRWIVDPLDGTTNWMHGYPEYAASVAAVDDRSLRVGVVLNSATDELFQAVRGAGAVRDGAPISVSGVSELEMALVGTGFPFKKPEVLEPYLATLGRVITRTSGARRAGSAALDLCDLACGRLDAFFEYWLQPWDVAAGALVLREAGGVFEPLEVEGLASGPPADPVAVELRPGAYLATNGRLREQFRALVEGEERAEGAGDG